MGLFKDNRMILKKRIYQLRNVFNLDKFICEKDSVSIDEFIKLAMEKSFLKHCINIVKKKFAQEKNAFSFTLMEMYEIRIKDRYTYLCIREVDLICLIRNIGYYLNKKEEDNVTSSILMGKSEKVVSREDFVKTASFYKNMAVKLCKLEELANRGMAQAYDLENENSMKALFELLDKIESDYNLIIE